jgi:copper chaperone
MEQVTLSIEGMTCGHCVRAVRTRLEQTPGVEVQDVQIGSATIRHDPAQAPLPAIADAIADEGYTVAHD